MNRAKFILAAYVALIAVLLFATPAHSASLPPTCDIPLTVVMENVGTAQIPVLKTKSSSYVKLNFQSVEDTAKAGIDFQAINTSLTLGNNTTSTRLPIGIFDRPGYQGPRRFLLKVTVLRNCQLPASYTPISVTINDDELPPPVPPPAPSGLAGETPIADNFDYASAFEPTTYGPNGGVGIPSATAINDLGAFRLDCGPGQLLKDDPIVLSGQAGTSHLHQFIGNLGTNAFSTYSSLRTTGGSGCGLINRSAYWTPAMIVGPGMALKPDHILIYYKRFPAGGPGCVGPMAVGICVDLPNAMRFVTGYNMKTMTGGPAGIGTRDYWSMSYDCWGSVDGTVGSGTATGIYHTIADVVAAGCPAGARLHVSIEAPTCWDGKNLDTADHRSHIIYPPDGTDKGMGYVCPADHPYVIPMMSVQLFYNTDANFVKGLWHLSSDEMIPGAAAGTTLHMDYFEAWSPTAKAAWLKNCINKPASCSGGDLGNGTAIIGGTEPYPAGWPKQAPVPATP